MKRLVSILLIFVLFCTGCGTKDYAFTGRYMDISGANNKVAYMKDYVMMDCCPEWFLFCTFARSIPNVIGVEGYEYYLYDENGDEVSDEHTRVLTVSMSEKFQEIAYEDCAVYMFGTTTPLPVTIQDGKATFETTKSGIFLLVKTGDGVCWIRNDPICSGQCKECTVD